MNPTYQAVLWKAMKYDSLKEKRAAVEKKVANKPKVRNLRSGTTGTAKTSKQKARQQAEQRYNETGSPRDLERLFEFDDVKF
jgi:hypothetical protein